MMMMLRKSVLKDISRKLFYQENCERGDRGKVVNLVSVFFHQRDCIGGFGQITTLTFAAKKNCNEMFILTNAPAVLQYADGVFKKCCTAN